METKAVYIFLPGFTMKEFFLAAALTSTLTILPLPLTGTALAATVRTISAEEAKGQEAQIPTLTIWRDTGLNLNFISTGEVVKKVWLDDISQIVVDFDSNLCQSQTGGQENCEDTETMGASVIHLRRINPINFPQIPKTQTTLLSVVTQGQGGRRNLYQFRIAYGKGTPQYVSVNVVPRENGVLDQIQQKAAIAPPPVRPIPVKPQQVQPLPSLQTATASPPLEERIRHIKTGLVQAQKSNLIGRQRRNLYLTKRVEQFLNLVSKGRSVEDSARQAGIPVHFVNTLEEMGANTFRLREKGKRGRE